MNQKSDNGENIMGNIFRISDGLGNQLFQYACAYSMYKKTGSKITIDPMYSGKLRTYQLDEFRIDFSERFINKDIDFVLGAGKRNSAPLKLWYRDKKIKAKKYSVVKEEGNMIYDESIYDQNNKYFIGFWQSYKYFDEYYEDIKRQFVMKKELGEIALQYAKVMNETVSVSLHIRRTDYNRSVNNVCLKQDFYRIALEKIKESIGSFKLFIFTDDKEFVRENFKLHEYELVENVSDLEEFVLMQKCKHHIIANSTFSWWAAYLSENKGGVVYAPVADMWTQDFFLPQWNCIKTGIGIE